MLGKINKKSHCSKCIPVFSRYKNIGKEKQYFLACQTSPLAGE